MSGKLGNLLKNYKEGKHLQSSSTSSQSVSKIVPYSPLWEEIQAYNQTKSHTRGDERKEVEGNGGGLGILFIIIDDFPNETLWRLWLSNHSEDDVRVWFHAKHPELVRSGWVRERLVKSFHLQPNWGSLDLTRVMLGLLGEALKTAPEVRSFVFASESCIPITPLSHTLQALHSPSNTSSWMLAKNTANNGFARQKQFDIIEKRIPKEFVWKADQWVLLSRFHAEAVVALSEHLLESQRQKQQSQSSFTSSSTSPHITRSPIFDLFVGMNASDELFFPTVLSLLGFQFVAKSQETSPSDDPVLKRRFTYADWSENGSSPKTFTAFHSEDFAEAREEGTIFFRKLKCQSLINREVRLEEKRNLIRQWLQIVHDRIEDKAERDRVVDESLAVGELILLEMERSENSRDADKVKETGKGSDGEEDQEGNDQGRARKKPRVH